MAESEISVSAFAAIMGVSRQTLIYYDRIGLFSPARVDPETGYRFYARWQINRFVTIQLLAALGLPLREIREEMRRVSPARMEEILARQREAVRRERARLAALEALMDWRLRLAARAEEGGEAVNVRNIPAPIPFFAGPPMRSLRSVVPDEAYLALYGAAEAAGLPFGYTMSYLADEACRREGVCVSRVAFRLGGPAKANLFLPSGTWLTARGRGDGTSVPVFYRLFRWAETHDWRAVGPAFEEYLLDEAACETGDDFLYEVWLRAEGR